MTSAVSQIAGQPNRGLGRVESAKASRWEQVGALEESRELDSVSGAKGAR